MNKQQAELIYRNRRTILDNIDNVLNYQKKIDKLRDKSAKKNIGQLSLFDVEEVEIIKKPELIESNSFINIEECVDRETELLGIPISYNSLDDLWIYEELYCTHLVTDLLEVTEATKRMIVMDKIVDIEYRTSDAGNRYCKLYLSKLGSENYCYMWGKTYRDYIPMTFKKQIYLFDIEYKPATKEFSRNCLIVNHLKNIKDVDIDEEYNRLVPLNEGYIRVFNNVDIKMKDDEIYLNAYKK